MSESSDTSIRLATYTAKRFKGVRDVNLPISVRMSETTEWTVFVLKSRSRHHSLLFEPSRGKAFYVELFVMDREITLRGNGIDLDDAKYKGFTKKHLGKVRKTAQSILDTAATVLQQLGDFHYVRKNCQSYCKALAKELGCGDYWSDLEKAIAGASVAAAAVAGGAAVAGASVAGTPVAGASVAGASVTGTSSAGTPVAGGIGASVLLI